MKPVSTCYCSEDHKNSVQSGVARQLMGGVIWSAACRVLIAVALSMLALPLFAQPQARSGYELSWSDEFDGTELDQSKWTPIFSTSPTNFSLHAYLPENVTVSDGHLRIISTNQPFQSFQYRSGQVFSTALHRYGRFEIRAKLPTSRGMWPAIWLLPDMPPAWPSQGEIDIMENRGNEPLTTSSAFHYGTNPPYNHQFVYREQQTFRQGGPVNYHDSFHEYAAEWDPEQVRFYVDGVHYYTVRNGDVGGFLTDSQTNPMRLIINTAIGGTFLPNPDATTQWPQVFEVDHVYVYDRVGEPVLELENSDFDLAGGSLSGWTLFGNSNDNVRSSADHVHSGSGALKIYGQFSGEENFSGVEQGVSVQPGDEISVAARAFVDSGDSIAGSGNELLLKVDFYNRQYGAFGSDEFIGSEQIVLASGSSPNDQWISGQFSATVPTDAVEARVALVFRQDGNAAGAVHVDQIEFENASDPVSFPASSLAVTAGSIAAGSVGSLQSSDDVALELLAAAPPQPGDPVMQLTLTAVAPHQNPAELQVDLELSANTSGLSLAASAFNFDSGEFELLGDAVIELQDTTVSLEFPTSPARFIDDNGNVVVRVNCSSAGPVVMFPWKCLFDSAQWISTPQ